MSSPTKDVYLVIGGSGFLGRHIVEALLARNDRVSVFDIVQRHHDVPFFSGDITDEEQVAQAIRKSGTTCIIHTASPPAELEDVKLFQKVNVDGTRAVVAAAVACGVHKLVYTSSAGVVFNGTDIINVDERLPYAEKHFTDYNRTKAEAEALVIAANGKDGLLTVAIRPAGIFGPGDRQAMKGFAQAYELGQTHYQLGNNENLFDWTYVTNVADAHLLAADRLVPVPVLDADALVAHHETITSYPLPRITATSGAHRVPTSAARPLGPVSAPTPEGAKLAAAFALPSDPTASPRPIIRSRYDALSPGALARAPEGTDPLSVAGQAFFIANGEPVYFWDMLRAAWHLLRVADPNPRPQRGTWRLPKTIGLMVAEAAEWATWMVGRQTAFTQHRVIYATSNRWHNIEKARRVLGYEPKVGVEEGMRKMVEWWLAERAAAGKAQ